MFGVHVSWMKLIGIIKSKEGAVLFTFGDAFKLCAPILNAG